MIPQPSSHMLSPAFPDITMRLDNAIPLAPDVRSAAHEQFPHIALSLCRFIGAAYATGAADCWEAAYRFAEETPGVGDSSLLVARAATLVRTLRCSRRCDLCYMPPSCRRLSKDEKELVCLLEAALRGEAGEVSQRASRMVDSGREGTTIDAVNALAVATRQ